MRSSLVSATFVIIQATHILGDWHSLYLYCLCLNLAKHKHSLKMLKWCATWKSELIPILFLIFLFMTVSNITVTPISTVSEECLFCQLYSRKPSSLVRFSTPTEILCTCVHFYFKQLFAADVDAHALVSLLQFQRTSWLSFLSRCSWSEV